MIENNIAIVCGAGTGADFGFPLGLDLIDLIVTFLKTDMIGDKNKTKLWLTILLCMHNQKDGNTDPQAITEQIATQNFDLIKKFEKGLVGSTPESIDDFLFANPDFDLLGRICIAIVISQFEKNDERAILEELKLFREQDPPLPFTDQIKPANSYFKVRRNWFNILWRSIYEGCNNQEALYENLKRMQFIIFNYDRNIQHQLTERIKSMYGGSLDEKIITLFKNNYFKHIYGNLGEYDFLEPRNYTALLKKASLPLLDERWEQNKELIHEKHRGNIREEEQAMEKYIQGEALRYFQPYREHEFGNDTSFLKEVLNRTKNLRTYKFGEKTDLQADTMIEWADKLVFLGFGYHEQNMKKLLLRIGQESKVIPSFINMTRSEAKMKIDLINKNIREAWPGSTDTSLFNERLVRQSEDDDGCLSLTQFLSSKKDIFT